MKGSASHQHKNNWGSDGSWNKQPGTNAKAGQGYGDASNKASKSFESASPKRPRSERVRCPLSYSNNYLFLAWLWCGCGACDNVRELVDGDPQDVARQRGKIWSCVIGSEYDKNELSLFISSDNAEDKEGTRLSYGIWNIRNRKSCAQLKTAGREGGSWAGRARTDLRSIRTWREEQGMELQIIIQWAD